MNPLCFIAFDQISASLIESCQVSHFPKCVKLSSTTASLGVWGLAGWNWEQEGGKHKVYFVEPGKIITGFLKRK